MYLSPIEGGKHQLEKNSDLQFRVISENIWSKRCTQVGHLTKIRKGNTLEEHPILQVVLQMISHSNEQSDGSWTGRF